jgi:hypothetical protein
MQQKSHDGVSAPSWHSSGHPAVLPALGVVLLGALGEAATKIEPFVDAAWFGLETQVFLGRLSALWVSLFLVSATFYGITRVAGAMISAAGKRPVVVWTRRFLAFAALFYWLMAIHYVAGVEAAGDNPSSLMAFHDVFQILMTASLTGLLWPFTFDLSPSLRPARAIFLLGLAILGISWLLLEPDSVRHALVSLGILDPPMDLVQGGGFLRSLPYLGPLAPLIWSFSEQWRRPSSGPARQA